MQLVNLLIFLNLLYAVKPYSFPEKFQRCHLSDPNLDNCLKLTIENNLRLIGSTGISSLNLPSIDPLEVSSVEIGAGTSAVHSVQKFTDIKIFGLSKFRITNVHFDLEQKVLTFTQLMRTLEQKAKYELDGHILVMPVFGKGDSDIILYNVTEIHTVGFEEEARNGNIYFKIKSYKLSVNPGRAHYQLDNLFNGDKLLSDNILKVVNDNWAEIFNDIKDRLDLVYAEIYKLVANRLFNTVPIREIFLN